MSEITLDWDEIHTHLKALAEAWVGKHGSDLTEFHYYLDHNEAGLALDELWAIINKPYIDQELTFFPARNELRELLDVLDKTSWEQHAITGDRVKRICFAESAIIRFRAAIKDPTYE